MCTSSPHGSQDGTSLKVTLTSHYSSLEKIKAEQSPGINLLNPFRTDTYREVENEEPPNPMLQQPQQATSTLSMLALLELEVLADSEHAHQNGLKSMVEIGVGSRYTRQGFYVNLQGLQEH